MKEGGVQTEGGRGGREGGREGEDEEEEGWLVRRKMEGTCQETQTEIEEEAEGGREGGQQQALEWNNMIMKHLEEAMLSLQRLETENASLVADNNRLTRHMEQVRPSLPSLPPSPLFLFIDSPSLLPSLPPCLPPSLPP
jgi:hypothetical protein